jgi:hypothetical protein
MIIQGKYTLSDKGRVAVLENRLEDAVYDRDRLQAILEHAERECDDGLVILDIRNDVDDANLKIRGLKEQLDNLRKSLVMSQVY